MDTLMGFIYMRKFVQMNCRLIQPKNIIIRKSDQP